MSPTTPLLPASVCLSFAACAAPPPAFEPAPVAEREHAARAPATVDRPPEWWALGGERDAPEPPQGPQRGVSATPGPGPSLRDRVRGFTLVDETSLREVADLLRALTGLPIVVDGRAQTALDDAGVVFDLSLESPISVRHLLDLLVELSGGELGWIARDGVVLLTTPERARGPLALRMYDVRDLTYGVLDAPGPRLGTLLSDGSEPEPRERVPAFQDDTLVDLIRETVAPGTWDDPGVSIELENGVLIVRHYARTHDGIASILGR